eukprot:TRINITY_DN17617_c0_g1_i1.p1 TRINITY_DN17617_c0_g1~~TRINITY_DN17617_c0_g1_i1.p1  ORF type:complete len:536 (-),score=94.79 TRINITY_DN17617_c0_g1_i1:125-1732(-)
MHSIAETVHRSIEAHQIPHWREHRSLIGWCSMNYPSVLVNHRYMARNEPNREGLREDMNALYQKRPASAMGSRLYRPFSSYTEHKPIMVTDSLCSPPTGFKKSLAKLTTTPVDDYLALRKTYDSSSLRYANVLPMRAEYTKRLPRPDFGKRVKQLGEVNLDLKSMNEGERHMKRLPNIVVSEQNLLEVLNEDLRELNLCNQLWVKREIFYKMGFFARNLEFVNLSKTLINDEALAEIGTLCANLKGVDVSDCPNLTPAGLTEFMGLVKEECFECLRVAKGSHFVTDEALSRLSSLPNFKVLDVSFCRGITDRVLQNIVDSGAVMREISLAGTNVFSIKTIRAVLHHTRQMELLDLGFTVFAEEGPADFLTKLGNSSNLRRINFAGCTQITDDNISGMLSGERDDNGNRLRSKDFDTLTSVSFAGLKTVHDGLIIRLVQNAPHIEVLDVNSCSALSNHAFEYTLNNLRSLRSISIEMIPGITQDIIDYYRKIKPHIRIVRGRLPPTDPAENFIRIPHKTVIKPAYVKKKPPAKKKR